MNLNATAIAGLLRAEVMPYEDERGLFTRLYCQHELKELVGARNILQINRSLTREVGAVRGCHFQHAPHLEMKLVRCLRGRVWDVVVDLRAGSSTFLDWHAEELSSANNMMMIVPEGCAHGFQVMEKDSELLYLHTAFYTSSSEGGVSPLDPILGIDWPLPVRALSDRDSGHPLITPEFRGLEI